MNDRLSKGRHEFDPTLLAVMASRLDGILREMSNVLLRSARSAIVSTARDFSCAIITHDDRLLATAEGLPVHVIGSEVLAKTMRELHSDFEAGDAFLHNDPYRGNTHAADHAILVPVVSEGVHLFTVCVKTHQADCGNSVPTTYMVDARDVYEEGALIFPCVRVQRGYEDVEDIIRMCRARIRVPEQWYGDYLATLGAARIGQQRLCQLVEKYSPEKTEAFIDRWIEYGDERMRTVLASFPALKLKARGWLDPLPGLEFGLELRATVEVDPDAGQVHVDLRDSPDCVRSGLNQSTATATASAAIGVLNSLHERIPLNGGSLSRIRVSMREGCIAGGIAHPLSCSVATTIVTDCLINTIQHAFAAARGGSGLAEGAFGTPPRGAVISGQDSRYDDRPFVNQLTLGSQGGPASPYSDGWVTYDMPVTAGLMYRDSVEINEHKYPILVEEQRLLPDTEGAGRRRGAPGSKVIFRPTVDLVSAAFFTAGYRTAPRGVAGGEPSTVSAALKRESDGSMTELPPVGRVSLAVGEALVSISSGGGGYGPPGGREPDRVLTDVREGLVSPERAASAYRVVVQPTDEGETEIDWPGTRRLRNALSSDQPDPAQSQRGSGAPSV